MMSDGELLQAYARQKSAAAFQELVRRHARLVYGSARQRVGDAHAAEDITQSVFLALAIKAHTLPAHTILTGWLYRVTRYTAIDYLRREQHRREREMTAHETQQLHGQPDPAAAALWQEISPHLPAALDRLSDTDRNAVLLRFYQQNSYAEIAEALRVSPDSARKRVDRALDRLRRFLGGKGIRASAGGLVAALGAGAAEAVPATVIEQAAQAALAGTGATMSWITTGGIAIMSTKLKIAAVAAIVCLLAGASWLALREPPPTGNPPTTNSATDLHRSHHELPSPADTSAQPVSVASAAAIHTNPPPPNAADIYRQAFTALEGLTPAELALLDNWKTNAVAPELCAKLQPIVELARQAAATTNCDWGVRFEGLGTRMPQLTSARQLMRALLWNATHCRQGDAAGSSADLLAALRTGANISEDLVGHLVNTAIQGMVLNWLADHAYALSPASVAELARELGGNQYEESLFRAVEAEAKGVDFEADRFAASTNSVGEFIQVHSDSNPLANLSREQALAGMRQVAALEREYATVLGLPDAEYNAWLTKLNQARQTNPVIILWPAMNQMLKSSRSTFVQRAMAVAGLQVLTSGPAVLTQYPDPATGQPFVYRPSANGFELQSPYQAGGKPVTLEFRTQ